VFKGESPALKKVRPILIGLVACIVLIFSLLSFNRNKVWQNNLTVFTDVIKKNPDAGHGYFIRGIVKYSRRDFSGSLGDYNKAIELKYVDPRVYNNRAIVKGILKDYYGAVDDCRKAIELNPDYADAYYNLGLAYHLLRDIPNACDNWKKAEQRGHQKAKEMFLKYCQ
jgi:tetratricopeptide (TPR) repeat protein